MVPSLARWPLCLCLLALSPAPLSAEGETHYREFSLGSSAGSVSDLIGSGASDLKTQHQRPALLQELPWSPRYAARRAIPDVDPVREMLFSFYNDQLYRIVVTYDPTRTAGLTSEDLIAELTGVYGPRLLPLAAPRAERSMLGGTPSAVLIARWQRQDASVSLYRSAYGSAYSLHVSSVPLETLALEASKTALAIHAREAPAREADRLKKQQDDVKVAEEKTRVANKGTFRP